MNASRIRLFLDSKQARMTGVTDYDFGGAVFKLVGLVVNGALEEKLAAFFLDGGNVLWDLR